MLPFAQRLPAQSSHDARAAALLPPREGSGQNAAPPYGGRMDVLHVLGHELRTPLNAIVGLAALALEAGPGDEQREYLEIIRSSGHALRRILDDVLDLAPDRAGSQAPAPLCELLRSALQMVASSAREKSLELLVRIDPQMPEVLACDSGRLQQILVNLLGNAVKFTDAGEVSIEVVAAADGTGYRRVWFAVSDTGCGISEQQRSRIFEPYWKLDRVPGTGRDGVGLGLAIAACLADSMGGELSVTSRPGAGSTFHFWIPLDGPESTSRRVTALVAPGTRAMVLEPHQRAREALADMLTAFGCRVDAVSSSADASRLVRSMREGYDWMFITANASHEEAVALIEEARSRFPSARLVMLLDMAGPCANAADFACVGAAAFLRKPVLDAELRTVLSARPGLRHGKVRPARRVRSKARTAGTVRIARILVAEDDPVTQLMLFRQLGRLGHTVQTLSSAAQAVSATRSQGFDLIFLDLQLPDGNGIEAARLMRASGVQTTPIIGLTAHSDTRYRDACLGAGMADCLAKPIELSTLQALLARHLSAAAGA